MRRILLLVLLVSHSYVFAAVTHKDVTITSKIVTPNGVIYQGKDKNGNSFEVVTENEDMKEALNDEYKDKDGFKTDIKSDDEGEVTEVTQEIVEESDDSAERIGGKDKEGITPK